MRELDPCLVSNISKVHVDRLAIDHQARREDKEQD
jgi:hypothetical protein